MRRDLHFKFRFDTANCEIVDMIEAVSPAPWKYAWHIQQPTLADAITCYSKDQQSKTEWFEAFQKERTEYVYAGGGIQPPDLNPRKVMLSNNCFFRSMDTSRPRVALSENAKKQIAHNVSDRGVRRSNSLKIYGPLRRSSSLKRSQTMKILKSTNKRYDLNMTI